MVMIPARRGVAATAVGVLTIALTAGCAASYGAARHSVSPRSAAAARVPAPAPVSTPRPSSVLQTTFPVAAYQLTPTQIADADYLTQRLQQLCMRKYGFSYNSGLTTNVIAQEVRINDEFETRLYGISDPGAARTYGYQLPPWTEGSAPPASGASLPRAELAVLDGTAASYRHQPVPARGCIGQADRQLQTAGIDAQTQQSGGSAPSNLPARIQLASFERAQSDPRVRGAYATWSACMRAIGDHYATPFKPPTDPRWAASEAPTRLEIQTAKHDIGCKLKANLLGVEFAVISDYENATIRKDAQALARVRASVQAQAAGIQRLMARYAP